MKLETFTYTGNGGTQSIDLSVITETPDLVFIKRDGSSYGIYRMTGMTTTQRLGSATTKASSITAINAGSFNIGADDEANASGATYYGFALYDDSKGDVKVGSYVGVAAATKDIDTTLANLETVWVFPDGDGDMAVHSLSMGGTTDKSKVLNKAVVLEAGQITDISTVAGQFTAGASLNTEGVTYRYLAFSPVSGFIDTTSYTGTSGGIDVDPNNGGNTPQFGLIMADHTRYPVWRTDNMVSGDSFKFGSSEAITDRLEDFSAETFTVGSNDDVANGSYTYHTLWLVDTTESSTLVTHTAEFDEALTSTNFATGCTFTKNKGLGSEEVATSVTAVTTADSNFIVWTMSYATGKPSGTDTATLDYLASVGGMKDAITNQAVEDFSKPATVCA